MRAMRQLALVLAVVAGLVTNSLAGPPRLASAEPWNNIFAGGERTFRYTVDRVLTGRVTWMLSRESRVLTRGEVALPMAADEARMIEFRVAIPEVKDGVVFACDLTVALVPQDASEAAVTSRRTLHLFPKDPFIDRQQWLKNLGIRLFDPEKKTAERFTKAGIPFAEIRTTDVLAAVRDGLVVVGEGVSLKEERGLAAAMGRAAEAGVPVLCLALRNGDMPMPPAGADASADKALARLTFRRADVVAELDKRLDWTTWAPDRDAVASSLVLSAERRVVAVEVVNGDRGWAWMEAMFPGGGRLVVCGFGIGAAWDDSPTPRYLLLRLLEQMGKKDKRGEDGGSDR